MYNNTIVFMFITARRIEKMFSNLKGKSQRPINQPVMKDFYCPGGGRKQTVPA